MTSRVVARHRHRVAAALRPDPEPRQHGQGLRRARAADVRGGHRRQRADAMATTREPDEQAPREQALGQGVAQLHGGRGALSRSARRASSSSRCSASSTDTEDRIQVARRIYNANVRAYDTLVQTFPALARRPAGSGSGRGPSSSSTRSSEVPARPPWTCQVRRRQVRYISCATSTSPMPSGPGSSPATWAPGEPWPASSTSPASTAPAGSRCGGRSTCCARRAWSRAAAARDGSRRSTRPPAPGPGHDRRGRGRSRRRAPGPARSSPSVSSTRPRRSPTRSDVDAATPRCCGSSG